MNRTHRLIILVICILIPVASRTQMDRTTRSREGSDKSDGTSPRRTVAITFDDLPVTGRIGNMYCDHQRLLRFTEQLTGKIEELAIPATGFVTESNICDDLRATLLPDLLTLWLDIGSELGNHTFSHRAFEETPLDEFKADVIRGETTTVKLLRDRGKPIRYFRYPYLHITGDSLKKSDFERFLKQRGYTVAPVTLDNDEWIYAGAYDRARVQGDSALMQRIGEDYIRYMEKVFQFHETFSRELVGYEIRQILLLHANTLNAEYLDELVTMMKERGYEFITLEEALQDQAYNLPDPYLGSRGLSWLQRLATGMEGKTRPQPIASEYVQEILNR